MATETLDVDESGNGPQWRNVLDRLEEHLASTGFRGNIHLTLSHHFVRFADLPWQPKILSRPLRTIQAEHRFKQLFGAAHSGWRVSASESAYGSPALAAAVENELIAAIEKIATKYPVDIRSIEPWGVASINTFRKQLLADRNAALALAEPGKQIMLFFQGTELVGVATRRHPDASLINLGNTVTQEAVAIGLTDFMENIFVARYGDALPAVPALLSTSHQRATPAMREHAVQTTS